MKPLHDKKHTLAKRGLSLLCVLALCLTLLPVTALAAEGAPNVLYVGNKQVISGNKTTYWTTDKSTGELTEYTKGGNDWNVQYDPETATLTLKNATIKTTHTNSQGAVIYAESRSSSAVSLTIELKGTNTIKCASALYGIYVNAEMSNESYGTDASLTITGQGSLDVSGSTHGIYVKSGTGDASLTIENASVDAKTTQTISGSGYAGVYVQSSMQATSSPQLSLKVNGGSLTANGGDGISFNVGSSGDIGATTSLTISDNAIVRAENGIKAYRVDKPTPSGTGIVFDDEEGTVYGNVTLDESLAIDQGETLTIGQDASLTVPENKTLTNDGTIDNSGSVTTAEGGTLTNNNTINNSGTLTNSGTVTNNGTINVESGGTVTGDPGGSGTVVHAPTIGTTTLPEGTVGTEYSWTLAADNNPTSWNVTNGALPDRLTLNSNGTISGTPTTAGTYTFTVTATNSAGSDSEEYTLTIKAVSVTDVSLDKDTLSLYIGDTASLTATVAPDNATNQNVTWQSNNANVATVEGGVVTAKGAGEATITVTTQDGGKTANCTVTVTDKTYAISADATVLNFGSAYAGYAQPAAKTVTLTNTGNQQVTVTLPTANDFIITAGTGFTDGSAAIKPGETATFTVQPKAGLSVGTYSDTITVSGSENVIVTIPASFTVKSRPSYNPPTVSEETTDAIADAQPGETVTVDLSSGSTKLDKDVFETLAGKDVTLVVDLGDGLSWTVNGSDIPEDATLTDIDMGVEMNSDGIPVNVINTITGEVGTVQITLAHNGEFGFTMTLTAPLGKENAGYWANLYHYKVNGGEADREDPLGDDEDAEALNFEAVAKIDEDGNVKIPFTHASQYAIVIDTHSHATVDVSDIFIDIAPDAWYKDAVQYAYDNGLMTGTSATTFEPEATTTRAMIVSILARLEGVTTAQAAGFADVDDNDWYATAVNWAANVGVVNGYEDNTFQPNTAITREQLAAILMNYAAYKGEDVSNRADLTSYTDQPSTWATETMSWAVAEGLISGVTADTLQPQGAATRAQVAAILQRFLSE